MHERMLPYLISLIILCFFQSAVELIIVRFRVGNEPHRPDQFLELRLGKSCYDAEKIIEVVAGVEPIFEENIHLLRAIVLIHSD